jgi:hypothetical protein
MCATPRPKRQAVLAALAAVVAVPEVVAKAIPSAPMPGAVAGVPVTVEMHQGRITLGTWFGETGLKIWPDVFRHDNVNRFTLLQDRRKI